MIYVVTILFTLAFVFYSKYQFDDEKAGWEKSKGLWHKFGFSMRALLFLGLLVYKFFPFSWWDFAICIGLNVIFDIGINIALGVKWFYTGQTSKLDKMFGKSKWFMYAIVIIGSLIGKIFLNNKNK